MDLWEIEFLKAMKGLSVMYAKECPRELLDLYRMVLRDLTVEELVSAVGLWISDPKHVFFPLPAQLKDMVKPVVDAQSEAQLVAERMWVALGRYGSDRTGEERAEKFINSEGGWNLVQNQGGWASFLMNNNTDMQSAPTRIAQWRMAIQAVPSFRRSRSKGLINLGHLFLPKASSDS